MAANPTLGKEREDQEFKASFSYIRSLRLAWTTYPPPKVGGKERGRERVTEREKKVGER